MALWTEGLAGEAVSAQCVRAAVDAAHLSETVGCRVEEVRPPVEGAALRRALDVIFTTNIRRVVHAVLSDQPNALAAGLLDPISVACFAAGDRHADADYETALCHLRGVAEDMQALFEQFDLPPTPP